MDEPLSLRPRSPTHLVAGEDGDLIGLRARRDQ